MEMEHKKDRIDELNSFWLSIGWKSKRNTFLTRFIPYIHTKKQTSSFQKSNLKILRTYSLTKTAYYHGSHLGILGETPIGLNSERLQALW